MDWEALSSTLATDLLFMSMTIHPVLVTGLGACGNGSPTFATQVKGHRLPVACTENFRFCKELLLRICSEGLGEKGRGSLVQVHVTLRAASVVWRIS